MSSALSSKRQEQTFLKAASATLYDSSNRNAMQAPGVLRVVVVVDVIVVVDNDVVV